MPKERATSDWWDDNLSNDILGSGGGKKSTAGSEWGDDDGSSRKSKQASAWDDEPRKASAWDDAPKEKQQSAWDDGGDTRKSAQASMWDDAPKEKAGSAWYDSGVGGLEQQSAAAAKARQESEWDAPASNTTKQKQQSEWDEAPTKKKGTSGWGKSFRMSFGLSQNEPKAAPKESKEPTAAAAAGTTPVKGKLRPPTAADSRQDTRFSFGISGISDSLGFGSSSSGAHTSAKKEKKSSRKTAEAEAPDSTSYFGSFLDPFGLFTQAPSPTPAPGSNIRQAGGKAEGSTGSSRPAVKDKRSSW